MSRLGTALVAAVALLSVGACTGEEPADGDPSAAPRASATPSATSPPTPPPLPAEAREHSADGAAAFVEYWNEVFNYAVTTGTADVLRQLSTPECGACRRHIAFIRRMAESGGSSESPGYRPSITSSQLLAGQFIVTADIATSSFKFRPTADGPTSTVAAANYAYLYAVDWAGASWRIAKITEQDSPR